jgi:RNA 2',3'-cyclic 3'-phosphodiesterase
MTKENGKVRLFYALPPCAGVLPALAELKKQLSENEKIRWIPEENLHLTLFFIGEVDADKVAPLIETMDSFLNKLKPFILEFDSIRAVGGRKGKSSMIWFQMKHEAFAETVQKLFQLTQPLCDTIMKFSKPVPHITLARIKGGETEVPLINASCEIPVHGIELWKTIRNVGGVHYEILAKKYL